MGSAEPRLFNCLEVNTPLDQLPAMDLAIRIACYSTLAIKRHRPHKLNSKVPSIIPCCIRWTSKWPQLIAHRRHLLGGFTFCAPASYTNKNKVINLQNE